MAKQSTERQRSKHPPEKKIGPYPGGVGVAIWINQVETDGGSREIRSITIAPRRYRDRESGEWRDAPSFRPGDLPALIHALTKAQDYIYSTPLGTDGANQDGGDDEIPY
jgi:hypothetical protein